MKWGVIAGLDPAIYLLEKFLPRLMDGRIKSAMTAARSASSGNRIRNP
jgi:hypothetical protein